MKLKLGFVLYINDDDDDDINNNHNYNNSLFSAVSITTQ